MLARLIVALLVMFLASPALATNSLSGISVRDNGTEATLILESTTKLNYKIFALEKPYRFVMDFEDTVWSMDEKALKDYSDIIKRVRHGTPKDGMLRIVMDVKRPLAVSNELFVKGDRTSADQLVLTARIDQTVPLQEDAIPEAPALAPIVEPLLPSAEALTGILPPSMQSSYPKAAQGAAKNNEPLAADTPIVEKAPAVAKGKPIRAGSYKPLIVIDPGHGGMDPGAIGKSGIREKNVTLDYAKMLKDKLLATKRYRVAMTRDKDAYVPLATRVQKARKSDADLFISIHADSHANPQTRGFSVYTLSENRAEREALKLEKRANQEEVLRGVDLSDDSSDVQSMLINMAQRETSNVSSAFAQTLVKHLGQEAKHVDQPHRSKSLAVLTGADLPSVLIELGYLSNRYEEGLLGKQAHKEKLTSAIADAINEYVNANRM